MCIPIKSMMNLFLLICLQHILRIMLFMVIYGLFPTFFIRCGWKGLRWRERNWEGCVNWKTHSDIPIRRRGIQIVSFFYWAHNLPPVLYCTGKKYDIFVLNNSVIDCWNFHLLKSAILGLNSVAFESLLLSSLNFIFQMFKPL